jgi:ABC-type antimicrobial peptide transport system permease subunit
VGSEDEYSTQVKQVDGDYIQLFQFDLIAGERLADNDSILSAVVNEKLAKVAGFENSYEIVGKEISLWGQSLVVKGVVKDFNTQSLSHAVEPVVLLNNSGGYQHLAVKLATLNMQESIEQIKKQWERQYPEFIFNYEFIDEQIRNLYKGERKTTTLLNVFAFMAVFIGCLGLLGLVMFMTNQKTKEVGVRKVLGASVQSIVFLFSKEFSKLILIGFALSAPLATLVMNRVLDEFAYKITIGPAILLLTLVVTFLIAFITVGYWSLKAALMNPVKSLRSE